MASTDFLSFSPATHNQGLLTNAAALRKDRIPRAQLFQFQIWKRICLVEAVCLLQRPSIHEVITLVGWVTGNSCLWSQWYHSARTTLYLNMGIHEVHKDLLCSMQSMGKRIQERPEGGGWGGRWYGGRKWGEGERDGDSFASLFPIRRSSAVLWFLQLLTFLESGTPVQSQSVTCCQSEKSTAHSKNVWVMSWGWQNLTSRKNLFCSPTPVPLPRVTQWALPTQSWAS